MRILSIHGKNLASLAGEFSLDFRQGPLANAGIFAITGPTGAGKSTLLDAMCLALFDSLPRLEHAPRSGESTQDGLSPSDPRGILRHGTGEGYAAIEFMGRDGHIYRSEWSVQRARKRPDGSLQASKMMLTCLDASPALPDRKKEIKDYILDQIGLNAQQFGRAVVLAQGEFEAFIKAPGDERAQLLEKLTGTGIYTRIGQLAFEKSSAVKKSYQAIEQQIAAKDCLPPADRAALEEQQNTAATAAKASATHLHALQTLQTWHAHHHEHTTRLEQAQSELNNARKNQDNAAPRRAALARNQSALTLAEFWRNSLDAQKALDDATKTLNQTRSAEQEAQQAVQTTQNTLLEAANTLAQAERQQKEAAPQLATARRADQELEAARQTCRTAHEKHKTCKENYARSQKQAVEASKALETAQTLQTTLQAWQEAHRPLERLTRDEHDIARRLKTCQEQAQHIENLQQSLQQHTAELEKAHAAMTAARQTCTEAEIHLQKAERHLHATQDSAPTAQQRAALHEDNITLSKLEQNHTALQKDRLLLTQIRQEHETVQADLSRLINEQQERQTARQHAEQIRPAQHIRAEEARKAATRLTAATDGTAQRLRDTLVPDCPCPVCGAKQHDLSAITSVLDEAAAQAQAEAHKAEQALHDTEQTLLTLNAADAAALPLRTQLEREQQRLTHKQADLESLCAQASATLHAALCTEADEPEPDAETLAQRLRGRQENLHARSMAMTRAQQDIDQANRDERDARSFYEKQRTQSETAAEHLRTVQHRHSTTQDDLQTTQEKQAELTDFLAERLDTIKPDWQNLPNPQRWLTEKTLEWRDTETRLNASKADLPILMSEEARATQARDMTHHQMEEAQKTLTQAETVRIDLERTRATLLNGQPVEAVETALTEATQAATKQHEHARNAHDKAKLLENTTTVQRQEAERTVLSATQKQALSQQKLDQNLLAASLSIADVTLAANLGADALAAEEKALHALETAITSAQAKVVTHQNLLADHETARPHDPTPEGLSLEQALQLARETANKADTALQDVTFRLRQDNEARNQTEKLRADLEQAKKQGRVWEELGDLLGDAKGKVLRGFAQNLTLDRLLGFANEKLAGLKPRYTLQRAGGDTPHGAMLIEVVDNDMGGQTRGLHNLSGGERFLVSLSLALGLSEMSCGQGVRIESLFIDEGFGSLDSNSLEQALAVLEHLHAQGRRVGVISHVEELKERILVKVEITPGASGRSSLTIITD